MPNARVGNYLWEDTVDNTITVITACPDDPTKGWAARSVQLENVLPITYIEAGELRPAWFGTWGGDDQGPTALTAYTTGQTGDKWRGFYRYNGAAGAWHEWNVPAGYDKCIVSYSYSATGGTLAVTTDAGAQPGIDTSILNDSIWGSRCRSATFDIDLAGDTVRIGGSGDGLGIRFATILAYNSTGTPADGADAAIVGTRQAITYVADANNYESVFAFAYNIDDAGDYIGGRHQNAATCLQTSVTETWTADGETYDPETRGFTCAQTVVLTRASTGRDAVTPEDFATISETFTFDGTGLDYAHTFELTAEKTVNELFAAVATLDGDIRVIVGDDWIRATGADGVSVPLAATSKRTRLAGGLGGFCYDRLYTGDTATAAPTVTWTDAAVDSVKLYFNYADNDTFPIGTTWTNGCRLAIRAGLEIAGGTKVLKDDIADTNGNPIVLDAVDLSAAAAKAIDISNDAASAVRRCTIGANVTITGDAENCIVAGTVTGTETRCIASASAGIDAIGVPTAGGNCDTGQGDATARPGIGHPDRYGRPKLDPIRDAIGDVYPQRPSPLNLLAPTVRYAGEMVSAP